MKCCKCSCCKFGSKFHCFLFLIFQNPFRKSKGLVQCVLFHPIRPYLLVAVSVFGLYLLRTLDSVDLKERDVAPW